MRTLDALYARYGHCARIARQAGKGYAETRRLLQNELAEYFNSPEGRAHVARSMYGEADLDWLADRVLYSVDGWQRVEEREERERRQRPKTQQHAHPFPLRKVRGAPSEGAEEER